MRDLWKLAWSAGVEREGKEGTSPSATAGGEWEAPKCAAGVFLQWSFPYFWHVHMCCTDTCLQTGKRFCNLRTSIVFVSIADACRREGWGKRPRGVEGERKRKGEVGRVGERGGRVRSGGGERKERLR